MKICPPCFDMHGGFFCLETKKNGSVLLRFVNIFTRADLANYSRPKILVFPPEDTKISGRKY